MAKGFQEVYFHLLDTSGANIEESIKLNNFHKKVELDEWFAVEGRACLVQRITFDHDRLDVVLKPVNTGALN